MDPNLNNSLLGTYSNPNGDGTRSNIVMSLGSMDGVNDNGESLDRGYNTLQNAGGMINMMGDNNMLMYRTNEREQGTSAMSSMTNSLTGSRVVSPSYQSGIGIMNTSPSSMMSPMNTNRAAAMQSNNQYGGLVGHQIEYNMGLANDEDIILIKYFNKIALDYIQTQAVNFKFVLRSGKVQSSQLSGIVMDGNKTPDTERLSTMHNYFIALTQNMVEPRFLHYVDSTEVNKNEKTELISLYTLLIILYSTNALQIQFNKYDKRVRKSYIKNLVAFVIEKTIAKNQNNTFTSCPIKVGEAERNWFFEMNKYFFQLFNKYSKNLHNSLRIDPNDITANGEHNESMFFLPLAFIPPFPVSIPKMQEMLNFIDAKEAITTAVPLQNYNNPYVNHQIQYSFKEYNATSLTYSDFLYIFIRRVLQICKVPFEPLDPIFGIFFLTNIFTNQGTVLDDKYLLCNKQIFPDVHKILEISKKGFLDAINSRSVRPYLGHQVAQYGYNFNNNNNNNYSLVSPGQKRRPLARKNTNGTEYDDNMVYGRNADANRQRKLSTKLSYKYNEEEETEESDEQEEEELNLSSDDDNGEEGEEYSSDESDENAMLGNGKNITFKDYGVMAEIKKGEFVREGINLKLGDLYTLPDFIKCRLYPDGGIEYQPLEGAKEGELGYDMPFKSNFYNKYMYEPIYESEQHEKNNEKTYYQRMIESILEYKVVSYIHTTDPDELSYTQYPLNSFAQLKTFNEEDKPAAEKETENIKKSGYENLFIYNYSDIVEPIPTYDLFNTKYYERTIHVTTVEDEERDYVMKTLVSFNKDIYNRNEQDCINVENGNHINQSNSVEIKYKGQTVLNDNAEENKNDEEEDEDDEFVDLNNVTITFNVPLILPRIIHRELFQTLREVKRERNEKYKKLQLIDINAILPGGSISTSYQETFQGKKIEVATKFYNIRQIIKNYKADVITKQEAEDLLKEYMQQVEIVVLVKWKGLSHIHSTWELPINLQHLMSQIQQKNITSLYNTLDNFDISRIKTDKPITPMLIRKKMQDYLGRVHPIDYNYHIYMIPIRIVSLRNYPSQGGGRMIRQYLILWAFSDYERITWESSDDIIYLLYNGIKYYNQIGKRIITEHFENNNSGNGYQLWPDCNIDGAIGNYYNNLNPNAHILNYTYQPVKSIPDNSTVIGNKYVLIHGPAYYQPIYHPHYQVKENSDLIVEYIHRLSQQMLNKTVTHKQIPSFTAPMRISEEYRYNKEGKAYKSTGPILELKKYQIVSVNRMLENLNCNRGTILADEMGLGKTVQIVVLLYLIIYYFNTGIHLIIAPLSTISNWLYEINRFTANRLNTIVYVGNVKSRYLINKYEFNLGPNNNPLPTSSQRVINIVLTTPDIILRSNLLSLLNQTNYTMIHTLAIDEAHLLKNRIGKKYMKLNSLRTQNRILITGTPSQNTLEELYNLLYFIQRDVFEDKLPLFKIDSVNKENIMKKVTGGFREEPQDESSINAQVTELQRVMGLISPYFIRRTKNQVEKELPPKVEKILRVGTTSLQKSIYANVLSKNKAELAKISQMAQMGQRKGHSDFKLLNIISQLKKICNHPYLINTEYIENIKEIILLNRMSYLNKSTFLDTNANTKYLYELMQQNPHYQLVNIVKASGKFLLLYNLMVKLYNKCNKILIFSTMTSTLDLIEYILQLMKIRYERLDGRTQKREREEGIRRFNSDPDWKRESQKLRKEEVIPGQDELPSNMKRFTRDPSQYIFAYLLSTKAGGLGINLSSANYVIIMDNSYNPYNDIQAYSRAHRIGQTKKVIIYNVINKNTIEENIIDRNRKKRIYERIVVGNMGVGEWGGKKDQGDSNENPDEMEMTSLLRFRLEKLFDNDNNAENDTLEDILERADKEESGGTTKVTSPEPSDGGAKKPGTVLTRVNDSLSDFINNFKVTNINLDLDENDQQFLKSVDGTGEKNDTTKVDTPRRANGRSALSSGTTSNKYSSDSSEQTNDRSATEESSEYDSSASDDYELQSGDPMSHRGHKRDGNSLNSNIVRMLVSRLRRYASFDRFEDIKRTTSNVLKNFTDDEIMKMLHDIYNISEADTLRVITSEYGLSSGHVSPYNIYTFLHMTGLQRKEYSEYKGFKFESLELFRNMKSMELVKKCIETGEYPYFPSRSKAHAAGDAAWTLEDDKALLARLVEQGFGNDDVLHIEGCPSAPGWCVKRLRYLINELFKQQINSYSQ